MLHIYCNSSEHMATIYTVQFLSFQVLKGIGSHVSPHNGGNESQSLKLITDPGEVIRVQSEARKEAAPECQARIQRFGLIKLTVT